MQKSNVLLLSNCLISLIFLIIAIYYTNTNTYEDRLKETELLSNYYETIGPKMRTFHKVLGAFIKESWIYIFMLLLFILKDNSNKIGFMISFGISHLVKVTLSLFHH